MRNWVKYLAIPCALAVTALALGQTTTTGTDATAVTQAIQDFFNNIGNVLSAGPGALIASLLALFLLTRFFFGLNFFD